MPDEWLDELSRRRARSGRKPADPVGPAPSGPSLPDPEHEALTDRLLAARDRAEAALDRKQAALDRQRAAEFLRRTYRDGLTGALQREAGTDRLQREADRTHRAGGILAIAFLDVNGLKQVNDAGGHAAGDQVLRAVGSALAQRLRTYDLVVRWGGDEFVCALPGSTTESAARRFDEVAALLRELHPAADFTVGIAAQERGDTLAATIDRADRDLYEKRRQAAGQSRAGRTSSKVAPTPLSTSRS
jgi:diguanylate cyclase (GGDEF)-like protein